MTKKAFKSGFVAIVGMPNVGKSSLINELLGEKRVIVSPIAGTTRDSIDTPFEKDGQKYLLIDTAGIKFNELPEEKFDNPLGEYTGAAVIFGATGGVMEAALRTANDVLTGKDNKEIVFNEVRGTDGLKEATYNIAGMDIKVCVASGAANAKLVMDKIAKGEADWTFVEIMGCPGGCVNGGGQPVQPMYVRNYTDLKAIRAKVLYDADAMLPVRKSHENPDVKAVYDEYFEKM